MLPLGDSRTNPVLLTRLNSSRSSTKLPTAWPLPPSSMLTPEHTWSVVRLRPELTLPFNTTSDPFSVITELPLDTAAPPTTTTSEPELLQSTLPSTDNTPLLLTFASTTPPRLPTYNDCTNELESPVNVTALSGCFKANTRTSLAPPEYVKPLAWTFDVSIPPKVNTPAVPIRSSSTSVTENPPDTELPTCIPLLFVL